MSPLQADYDNSVDVLYIYKDQPVAATTEEDDNGLLLRYSNNDGKPAGVTVVCYRRDWAAHRDALSTRVADFLDIDPASVERALAVLDIQESAR